MSRHAARVHSLNLVFQFPFHPEWDPDQLQETVNRYLSDLSDLDGLVWGLSPNKAERSFIMEETHNTFVNLPQIDDLITKHLKNWDFDRIAKIDLAVLRLAIYEICWPSGINPATAINEAIELAKKYGTDDSPVFINGVLGQVAKCSLDTLKMEI